MIIESDTYDCFAVKATFESDLPTPASMTGGRCREQLRGCREATHEPQRGSKEWMIPLEDRGIPQFNHYVSSKTLEQFAPR